MTEPTKPTTTDTTSSGTTEPAPLPLPPVPPKDDTLPPNLYMGGGTKPTSK